MIDIMVKRKKHEKNKRKRRRRKNEGKGKKGIIGKGKKMKKTLNGKRKGRGK